MASNDYYTAQDGEELDLVELIYDRRKRASKHAKDWRGEARENYQFRDGDQWDDEDRALLEEQGRPVVTFNRVGPIIDSVAGHEIGNRQEARYFPRTLGDREANDTFTEGARWVRDGCEAEDEESDAYTDTLTCGMGWIETRVDYDEDPDGKIIMERVSPLQMRWDPAARKQNLLDAAWLIREKWMDLKAVKDEWPDARDLVPEEDSSMVDPEGGDAHDSTSAWKYENDQSSLYDPREGKILVLHYQYREKEFYYRVGDTESDRVVEFTEERFNKIKDEVERRGIAFVKQTRWKYFQAFVAAKTLLEDGPCAINAFTYRAITGKRDEQNNIWYGLMRAMKDPQQWANKFFSQTMYIFNSNAKGGVIAEEDAVDDKRAFEDSWASSDGVNWVNNGALQSGKIQDKPFGGYPAALDKLLSFAISSIRDVSGVNLELMGMANREQAGVLEVERKKAALVILAPLLNNLRRYRKVQALDMLSFMREYISEGTLMRITDKEAVPFAYDADVTKYDVVIDTAPSSPNMKQEVWANMQSLVPAMIKAGVPLPPDLIKYSPLPESVSDEWVKYIEEKSQTDPELPQKMAQMQEEMGKLKQENDQLKGKREQQMADMQRKREEHQMEMEMAREKMLLERQTSEQELAMKAKTNDADRAAKLIEIQARYDTERSKLQQTCELERDVSAAKIKSAEDVQVISLQAEREKRMATMKTNRTVILDELTPDLMGIVDDKLAKVSEKLNELSGMKGTVEELSGLKGTVEELARLASDTEGRRNAILAYVSAQGGELGEVANKLR